MSRLLSCLHPVSGWRLKGINHKSGRRYGMLTTEQALKYPPSFLEEVAFRCGKCFNCLKFRSSVLLARCVAESRMHDDNAFVTLTVDDDHIQDVFPGLSLRHKPFQDFFKRLRKRVGSGVKYLMCAEYGELSLRPHYHALIFGVSPYLYDKPSKSKFKPIRFDNPVFSDSWGFGNVYVGTLTPASAAYCSGYTLKQYTLGRDDLFYATLGIAPEYIKWSRRPGLGSTYFDKFDIFADDGCGVPLDDGRRLFAGRYYLDWLRLHSPDEYDILLSSYEDNNQDFDFTVALDDQRRKLSTRIVKVSRSKRI